MSNTQVNIKFQSCLLPSNPEYHPVLFVGQASHLECLTWEDAQCKLRPNVTEEAWTRGMSSVLDSPGECCEIWPKAASVATLPARRSRHAAPSRCHALANLAKAAHRKGVENIVVVCEKRDVFASALAIARCVPLFNMRSAVSLLDNDAAPPPPRQLAVQFKLVPPVKDGPSDEDSLGPLDPYLEDVVLSDEDIVHIQAAADSVRLAARITDTPTNFMDVDQFIQEAIKVAKDLKIAEPTIIRGEELKEKGLGGIYGVGKAAECPPALVVLSYKTASPRTVAWVGKGIVYDTGGLSIKARTSMVGMKGDCGGAAAVLGAFFTAVRAGPSVNLHAVLCLAENAVGPKATRPDDIHQLYSGRTVEINNTDAEGRLVLSDGVVYAQRDLKADTIVDIATLTGAQGTATGKYHAAILSNSGVVERQCVRAGLSCGDLAHPLPFAPELHFPEFTSVVADMKNSVADRGNAQASCAGLFILAHLGFDFPGKWLHIDMAAPAHSGERATGYGVGLLSVLFGAHTKSRLLNALSPGPIA